jgi:hypothetical protein
MKKTTRAPRAFSRLTAALIAGLAAASALAQTPAAAPAFATPPALPTAESTDPVKLGWMVGSPPPPDKIIRFADGSFYTFPKFRWSFSNSASSARRPMSRVAWARRCRCRAPSATTSTR